MSPNDIIKMACNGNAEAERFCLSWVAFAHVVDDLADKDKPLSGEQLAATFVTYTLELCGNPFFLAHRAQLLGLMVQSANAWVDSNNPANGDLLKDCAEHDVLKGQYHEVVFHCAFILGGWSHLRKVTSQCREYDFEKDNSENAENRAGLCGAHTEIKESEVPSGSL